MSEAINEALKIKTIDTPGFGDHRVPETRINQILKDLTLRIVKDEGSSNRIDAFLLVVKLDPRPASLKVDLEQLVNIFGTAVMKSIILLPILHEQKNWSDE